MSDILHDAAFTTVEITKQLVFNNKVFLDENLNVHVNKVFADEIVSKTFTIPDGTVYTNTQDRDFSLPMEKNDPLLNGLIQVIEGTNNTSNDTSVAIGGYLNESLGEYSGTFAGRYNESTGRNSVALGGTDNQSTGTNTVACGQMSVAKHDNTFVWNAGDAPCETTMPSQFMVGSDKGMFFKLPNTTDIPTHLLPEGYSVWCWEESTNKLCLKTKRNNMTYKTYLPSEKSEIQIDISVSSDGNITGVNLLNPDLV